MIVKILIIDDEELFREDLALLLSKKGYDCQTANTAEEGIEKATSFQPDVILCDIVMPGKSGIDILDDIRRKSPEAAIIMMTAFGTLETAIDAFRKGAADYILKPLIIEDVTNKIERLIKQKKLEKEIKYLHKEINEEVKALGFVGQSDSMKNVSALIGKVAPMNSTVLITGESGTGKELIARAIHQNSPQKNEPFIAINCSGLQESLLESELFGHVKGAFTGAATDKEGLFEIAGEGVIFLDEISEMPFPVQSKLLRVLEQREYYRLGGTKLIKMKARVLAAANKDLKQLLSEKKFRDDLYYRIAVFEIALPPLRERTSDIPHLTEHFIHKFNKEMNLNYSGISSEALETFMSYKWPGNIRELRNVIERAMILCNGETISVDGLPPQLNGKILTTVQTKNLKKAVQTFEKVFIMQILNETNWNKEKAAKILEINPSTLYRKMAELNIRDSSSSS